jgi:hypothetical protein
MEQYSSCDLLSKRRNASQSFSKRSREISSIGTKEDVKKLFAKQFNKSFISLSTAAAKTSRMDYMSIPASQNRSQIVSKTESTLFSDPFITATSTSSSGLVLPLS